MMAGSFYNEHTDMWLIPVSGQLLTRMAKEGEELGHADGWSAAVQFRFEKTLDGWELVIRNAPSEVSA